MDCPWFNGHRYALFCGTFKCLGTEPTNTRHSGFHLCQAVVLRQIPLPVKLHIGQPSHGIADTTSIPDHFASAIDNQPRKEQGQYSWHQMPRPSRATQFANDTTKPDERDERRTEGIQQTS